jgi:thiamine biosynthesis protein ThiS
VTKIHLNGDVREISDTTDLARLVHSLGLVQKRIAVEVNGTVVSRDRWPKTIINDDDRIEVVHFVGGG